MKDKKIRNDIIEAVDASNTGNDFFALYKKTSIINKNITRDICKNIISSYKRASNIIYQELKDQVEFCCVYIKEAHPMDGWVLPDYTSEGIEVDSPETKEERAAIAATCMLRYNFPFRMVLDSMADEAEEKYRSEPDRLYVIDAAGKISWKSGLGPFYFDVEGWYEALRKEF